MTEELINALEDLKEKKEPFSLYTLMINYKIPKNILKENIKEIINTEGLTTYVFIYCTNCNKKVFDIEYSNEFFKKSRNCYKCKEDFLPLLENSQFLFDFRTLKERFKAL